MSKILVIEDEAAIRRVLIKIISEESDSYVVEEAENGLEGIEKFKDNYYDLVENLFDCLFVFCYFFKTFSTC